MEISIATQTLVFLRAVMLGIAIGIVYDLLRALRRTLRAGVGLTAVCDTLFWLVTVCALFVFVLLAADGEGRSYVLLGTGLGALLYFIALSPPVLIVSLFLLGWVAKLAQIPAFLWKQTEPARDTLQKIGKTYKEKRQNFKKLFPFIKK